MYLTAGPLDLVTDRLRMAAPSPHWRNTWLFAAGRLFSTPQDHHHQAVVELIESIDDHAHARLSNVVPIGPRLALDVIDDGMARSLPRWRTRLITRGLRVLNEPMPPDLVGVARVLVRFADGSDAQRQLIAEGLRDALSGTRSARETAQFLQRQLRTVADEIDARQDTRWLDAVRGRPGTSAPVAPPDGWHDFDDELAIFPRRRTRRSG